MLEFNIFLAVSNFSAVAAEFAVATKLCRQQKCTDPQGEAMGIRGDNLPRHSPEAMTNNLPSTCGSEEKKNSSTRIYDQLGNSREI